MYDGMWVSSRFGCRQRCGLILVVSLGLGSCARSSGARGPTEPESVAVASPDEGGPGEDLEPEAERDAVERARLDREIALHERVVAEADGEARLRSQLALGDAYLEHAYRAMRARWAAAERRAEVADAPRATTSTDAEDLRFVAECDAWLERAVAAYEAVLASELAPGDVRPRAYWGLADVRREQGDEAAADALLQQLVAEDPRHPLAVSAELRLGDMAFARGQLDHAGRLYQHVTVASTVLREQLYAHYKLGWVHFNRADPARALEAWVHVTVQARADPNTASLGDEAAKDCVRAYVEVGRPEVARAFFERIHPERAPSLVRSLVQAYLDAGREDDARAVGVGVPGTTAPRRMPLPPS